VPHPVLREGIREILTRSGMAVTSEPTDADAAVRLAGRTRPDACLVDADLPGGALVAVGGIMRTHPRATVVVLADCDSHLDVVDTVRAGAVGYLDKDVDAARLPRSLRAALDGEALIPRRLVAQLTSDIRVRSAEPVIGGWGPIHLTRREFEVLDLMRAGLGTSCIAERLFVSPGTVRSHVMSMMRKLHVEDREALVRCASRAFPRQRAVAN
jgi:DNA-binding NarL/FixJ family response regulator